MTSRFDASTAFLHRAYERTRKLHLVWSAAAILTASAVNGAGRLGWIKSGETWALIPALISALLLASWFRRVRGLTAHSFAQELDVRWHLQARLESTVELSNNPSALAQAQRTEAKQQLGGRENAGLAPWLAALAVVALALSTLGTEGAALVLRRMQVKSLPGIGNAASSPSQSTPGPGPAAIPDPRAAIEWKTPDPEIKATAIEEVPLTASADSLKGFRAVRLEVSVNGEPKFSHSLDAAALGESGQPGPHELTPSLLVDETGAKPFDIIAYALSGELSGIMPPRVVTSPLQFIQVRLPAEDVPQTGEASEKAIRLLSQLSSLKLAQLRLLEANFTLARLSETKADPAWQSETAQIALHQKELASQAKQVGVFATEIEAPALIAKNLGDAEALMTEAAKQITAEQNESATKPQGKALALITECEKFFHRALTTKRPPLPPLPMDDPFRTEQVFKLQAREETPAGKLEGLATRQHTAADQLAPREDGQTPDGQAAAKNEASIAREAERLAESGELDPSVKTLLLEAGAAVSSAVGQLRSDDLKAAREPAGIAFVAFQKAVETHERLGRETAVETLARVRRSLNAASRTPDSGERGASLVAARDELRAAAVRQQRTGSAEAARELVRVSEWLAASNLPGATSKPNSTERARAVASTAARSQVSLGLRPAALNRAIRQLNRAQPFTNGTSLPAELAQEIELVAQESEWLTSDAPTADLARQVSGQTYALLGASAGNKETTDSEQAAESAVKLAAALELARGVGKRDEIVRQFNLDRVDPAYRTAVETYFERLSRGNANASPPPVPTRP